MDFIKTWALRIVVSSVMVSFVLIMSPGGALEKSVKTAISLFMLFTIIYPFLDVSSVAENFDFSDEIVQPEAVDGGKLIIEEFEKKISEKVEKLLTEEGINVKVVDVNVILTDKNEIAVENVNVVAAYSSEWSAEEIKLLINDNCGLNAEVEVTDGQ